MTVPTGFSFQNRQQSLDRFKRETFDFLIIGGGITGAAVARDAALRGLKVALVERCDFAHGTSSRSSKLIHGGLRYLENLEFGLVFEALAERTHLLKTAPNMVRPLPFFFPVYRGDSKPKFILSLGLWLYDLLALFRAPGAHQNLSRRKMLEQIPFLQDEGLKGGFRYFDASMWDDVLAIQTLRSASAAGVAIANYTEATSPLREGERVVGFKVRDLEKQEPEIEVRAKKVIVCAGPWTDEMGARLSESWSPWLKPSKGVHLVFDLKRIPIPGAMVMSHPKDGRISFVIPRPDFGAGVVIVGTTDSPSPQDPDQSTIESSDVDYLLGLLNRYFPKLELKASDILSAYVGVRPLMGAHAQAQSSLQKVSREHFIGYGPGGVVLVAGGKYTTHRQMAEQIVDFTLKGWRQEAGKGVGPAYSQVGPKRSEIPVNASATREMTEVGVPKELFERYGAEALAIRELDQSRGGQRKIQEDPAGFPMLEAQLRYSIQNEMVLHLEDFFFRRQPIYLSRADHGMPWAQALAQVWAEERGLSEAAVAPELERLKNEMARRSSWVEALPPR